jgi:pyridoxine kinase
LAILSFQSSVAYGHVGNAAAVFCLRRSGHEIWPVDTVAFSNHPGYGGFGGHVRQAAEVAEIVDGVERLGVLGRCRAVLSGYLGSAAVGRVVLESAARVKTANPRALFCCDPVMGDREEGLYVPDDLAALLTDEAVGAADVLVPNHFELEVLAGRPLPTLAEVVAAVDGLRAGGCRIVVVTSLATADRDASTIANLVVTGSGAWTVTTPKLALAAKGAGDVLAALFPGRSGLVGVRGDRGNRRRRCPGAAAGSDPERDRRADSPVPPLPACPLARVTAVTALLPGRR